MLQHSSGHSLRLSFDMVLSPLHVLGGEYSGYLVRLSIVVVIKIGYFGESVAILYQTRDHYSFCFIIMIWAYQVIHKQ